MSSAISHLVQLAFFWSCSRRDRPWHPSRPLTRASQHKKCDASWLRFAISCWPWRETPANSFLSSRSKFRVSLSMSRLYSLGFHSDLLMPSNLSANHIYTVKKWNKRWKTMHKVSFIWQQPAFDAMRDHRSTCSWQRSMGQASGVAGVKRMDAHHIRYRAEPFIPPLGLTITPVSFWKRV